ncbi:cytochrome b5 [Backusella circina FSU 941]|nr:cytochrome b5 [Backusella circina FSU 941]
MVDIDNYNQGVPHLGKYTLEDIRQHRTPEDAWTAIQGKVYNLTPYLKFHPGGEKDLMRCAGRDGTKLYMLTHSWVNIDYLMDQCMVGFLVPS